MRERWPDVADALSCFHVRATAALAPTPPATAAAADGGVWHRLRYSSERYIRPLVPHFISCEPAPPLTINSRLARALATPVTASLFRPLACSCPPRHWIGLVNDCYATEDLPSAFREALSGSGSAQESLAAEAAWLERLVGSVPQDVFCHNDLQHGCEGPECCPQSTEVLGCRAENKQATDFKQCRAMNAGIS